MCGICGLAYVDPARPVELDRLLRMRAAVAHRGPDGAGERREAGVGLGHTRLSIIDVATGQQPLANEDGSIWITFNGEIYNYRELATQLQSHGHTFRTRSDTEVLVHAYETWGLNFVERLNGMFAFGLHDVRNGRVVLGRDHLGIKPLFYSVTDEGLFFGSEIKAVLAGSGCAPRLQFASLQEYLVFRYVAGSRSFFHGVHRLPPGHVAVWQDGRLQVQRYWTPPGPAADNGSTGLTLDQATDRLEELLAEAVRSQLMSEVPLGTFCSGGVDSGLVTTYAARHADRQLATFSVGFAERTWDETALAQDTATRARASHHVLRADPHTFQATLHRLIWHHDEPLSHPNSVPLYLLSRFARQFVTVVLTGEGADELFGGYPRYHITRLRHATAHLPQWSRALTAGALRRLPGHRAAKLAELLPLSYEDAVIYNSAYVSPALVSRLTGAPINDAVAERRDLAAQAFVPGDAVATMTRYELATYLGCALDRMDRMSMASGLEGRVPFLDLPLVEWTTGLRSALKVRARENKRVVKRLAERYLSPRITRGAKSGFGIPLKGWFQDPAFSALLDRMRDPRHPAAAAFDRPTLDRLLGEHLRGDQDHGEVLWLLANVYLWHEVQLWGNRGD